MMFRMSVPMLSRNRFHGLSDHFTIQIHKDASVKKDAGSVKDPDKNDNDGACRTKAIGKIGMTELPANHGLTYPK